MRRALLILIVVTGCSGSSSTIDPSKDGGGGGSGGGEGGGTTKSPRAPTKHRPTSSSCSTSRGPGVMTPPHSAPPSGCDADATCTAGKNGRCYTPVSGCGCAPNICTYDECFSDAECADGSPCECRAAFAYEANVCVKNGNCRVDTDCGAAGYCSPSGVSNCMTAYFCHTPDDECVDAADCSGDHECAFDAAAKRWKCGPGTCGPVG